MIGRMQMSLLSAHSSLVTRDKQPTDQHFEVVSPLLADKGCNKERQHHSPGNRPAKPALARHPQARRDESVRSRFADVSLLLCVFCIGAVMNAAKEAFWAHAVDSMWVSYAPCTATHA